MPRVSQFHGIAIYFYYRDHPPPHFHAIQGENDASVEISSASIVDGSLPRSTWALVRKWATDHQDELLLNWDFAQTGQPLIWIEPLP